MKQALSELDTKIRQILAELEGVRENLLTLSDDIWLSIDHNDTHSMEEGVKFKQKYNEKLVAFDQLVSDLSGLVRDFTKVPVETDRFEENDLDNNERNERIIRELDRDAPHSLEEDFRYKRPYGIVFQGQAHNDLVTWNRVYYIICRKLIGNNPEQFIRLTSAAPFVSNRGNKDFSRDKNDLRQPMKLIDGIYAEANLSANSIRDRIKRLLKAFGISRNECKIYLREDRNAEGSE